MRVLLAALRSSAAPQRGLLRRALLTLILVSVAFSVVGMHQLSLSHSFAVPTATGQHEATADAGSGSSQHDTMAMGVSKPAGQFAEVPVMTPDGSWSEDDACPGCGGHPMGFTACLLALTLLVLFWWLVPPRVRRLPPKPSRRLAAVMAVPARRVPALSMTELSILRT